MLQTLQRLRRWTQRLCCCWLALFAVMPVPAVSLAFDQHQVPDTSDELEPARSQKALEESAEPSFFVLPIRTELQRKLVADGKPVHALVEVNGFATMGKRGVERMRALDILALRRALAGIKASDPNGSVAFTIAFMGVAPPNSDKSLSAEQELLTQECRDLAKGAKLRVTQIYANFIGIPGLWTKVAQTANSIDLSKETEPEAAVVDTGVR